MEWNAADNSYSRMVRTRSSRSPLSALQGGVFEKDGQWSGVVQSRMMRTRSSPTDGWIAFLVHDQLHWVSPFLSSLFNPWRLSPEFQGLYGMILEVVKYYIVFGRINNNTGLDEVYLFI